MTMCLRRDTLTWLQALLDDPKILLCRPASPTADARDHLYALKSILRHKPILEDILKPPALCRVSAPIRGQSTLSLHDMGAPGSRSSNLRERRVKACPATTKAPQDAGLLWLRGPDLDFVDSSGSTECNTAGEVTQASLGTEINDISKASAKPRHEKPIERERLGHRVPPARFVHRRTTRRPLDRQDVVELPS